MYFLVELYFNANKLNIIEIKSDAELLKYENNNAHILILSNQTPPKLFDTFILTKKLSQAYSLVKLLELNLEFEEMPLSVLFNQLKFVHRSLILKVIENENN
jgi:hypothetical protein